MTGWCGSTSTTRPSWSATWPNPGRVSPDGKTYTFELKPGLKFASGNPLTADDVAYSLQRAVSLDKSPAFILTQFGFTKDNVKDKIKATGPLTVTLETDKAYAPTFVLNCLTANIGAIVDKKLVMSKEQNGDWGYAWLKTNYAGSGPLKLREWRANEIVALERNDNYYGDKPKLARVIYRHVKEAATQRLLLEKGDIDIARNLSPQDIAALSANKDIKLVSAPKGTVYYISLNQKNPNLAKPEVREALKWLVDYSAIGDTLIKNIGVVHQNFLPMGLLGASKDNPYKLDVAKAKALLAKAGVPERLQGDDRHAHRPAGAGHHRSLPADRQAGRHRDRDHSRRRQADADQVPRPHARHVHRPVGRRTTGTRTPTPTPSRATRTTPTTPRPSRWPGAMPGTIPELTKKSDAAVLERDARQAQEDVRGAAGRVPQDQPLHHAVPADRGGRLPQQRRWPEARPDV